MKDSVIEIQSGHFNSQGLTWSQTLTGFNDRNFQLLRSPVPGALGIAIHAFTPWLPVRMALCSHVVNCYRDQNLKQPFQYPLLNSHPAKSCLFATHGLAHCPLTILHVAAFREITFLLIYKNNLNYSCISCKHEGFSDRNPKWPLH